jgi:hypothetical protein
MVFLSEINTIAILFVYILLFNLSDIDMRKDYLIKQEKCNWRPF